MTAIGAKAPSDDCRRWPVLHHGTACQQPRVNGLTRLMPKNIPIGKALCEKGEE
jgi:hypothetical protein